MSLTIHNRNSFVSQFLNIFQYFNQNNAKITGDEIHQLLCLLCPDFPTSIIYLALSIINDSDNGKQYPFQILSNVVLNVFLYWDIINYIQKLFENNTNNDKDNDSKTETISNHREYVFIGEIRTAIFEFQIQNPSEKELCETVLNKIKTSIITNKVTLLEFCRAITITAEDTNTDDNDT